MALTNREGKSSGFNYVVIFVLGVLIASNGFLFYQVYQTQKLAEGLRNDAINIIQAYNNLVNTLTQQGVLKAAPSAPSAPKAPAQEIPSAAPTNENQ